jgi:hypothetical protein
MDLKWGLKPNQLYKLSLKRRRAIAKNKQGVVMLKGEWSFSSIDQILIDELVFYIQTKQFKSRLTLYL